MLLDCRARVVQMGWARSILSASVAFVALSGEAEYAYGCLQCPSTAALGFARPETRRLRGCEDVVAWFGCVSGGAAKVRLGTAASGTARIVKTFQELGERNGAIGGD